jgi:hypothetical protein
MSSAIEHGVIQPIPILLLTLLSGENSFFSIRSLFVPLKDLTHLFVGLIHANLFDKLDVSQSVRIRHILFVAIRLQITCTPIAQNTRPRLLVQKLHVIFVFFHFCNQIQKFDLKTKPLDFQNYSKASRLSEIAYFICVHTHKISAPYYHFTRYFLPDKRRQVERQGLLRSEASAHQFPDKFVFLVIMTRRVQNERVFKCTQIRLVLEECAQLDYLVGPCLRMKFKNLIWGTNEKRQWQWLDRC